MQYIKKGNFHQLSRITGPSHNLLAIEFGDDDIDVCFIQRLGPSDRTPGQLTDDEVKQWVLTAVAEANARLGTRLSVRRIQYVGDDTRDPRAYSILAHTLVDIASGHNNLAGF
jgi:hypothetical protein